MNEINEGRILSNLKISLPLDIRILQEKINQKEVELLGLRFELETRKYLLEKIIEKRKV